MAKLKKKDEKENAFRLATTVFLIGAISSFVGSLVCIEDDLNTLGIYLALIGVALISISVWTFYHPFYPVILGMILALILTTLTIQYHPEDTIHSKDRRGPFGYIIAADLIIFYALIIGFKEWRNAKKLKNISN